MKCLAQKLTKWRRIEKLCRKREIDRFRELKELVRFALCRFPTHLRQSGSHFAQGGSILPKLVSMASQLQMAKSQEALMPQILRNLRNYGISEPWADSAPPLPPDLIGLKTKGNL